MSLLAAHGAMLRAAGGGDEPTTAYYAKVMASSPALYLRLSELSGAPANSGSVALTSGSYGSGVELGRPTLCNGIGDYSVGISPIGGTGRVRVFTASGALRRANNFSFSCLIRPSSIGTRAIFSFDIGSGVFFVRINVTGAVEVLRSNVASMGSFGTVEVGVTCHIGVTVAPDGTLKFYFNGVPAGTGTTYASWPTGGSQVCVGTEGVSGSPFDGDIDEVAFFHTELSAAAMAAQAAAAGL